MVLNIIGIYIYIIFICVCTCMRAHCVHIHPWHVFTRHSMHVTEDNLWELALFFHHGDLMVVRLRHAPLLSHLASIQIWYLLIDRL